jgi:hypothetical protein
MSTHDDWLAAKKRRDDAAYMLASAYTEGVSKSVTDKYAAIFTAAEEEMTRIAKELDGRAGK